MLKLTPSPQLILCFLVLLPLHWVQETIYEMTDSKGGKYCISSARRPTTFSPSTLQHLSIASWERGAPQITIKINLFISLSLPRVTSKGTPPWHQTSFSFWHARLSWTTDALLLIYSDLQYQRLPFAIPVNSFLGIATWQITSDNYDLRESHTEVRVSVFVHSKTTHKRKAEIIMKRQREWNSAS